MKWQDWEDHRLLSSGLTALQLAERLGRSAWSVQRRRSRLKNLLPDHAQKTLLEIKVFKKLWKSRGRIWQDSSVTVGAPHVVEQRSTQTLAESAANGGGKTPRAKASKCKETLPPR